MEEQKKENWIEKEQEQLPTQTEFVKLPAVKFEEGKIKDITIDFSAPFQKWTDPETKKVKAIIPCLELENNVEVQKNFWLNILNPLYKELLAQGKSGIRHFRILQTGTAAKTRYILLK